MTAPDLSPQERKAAAPKKSIYEEMQAEVEQTALPPLVLQHPMPGMEAWYLTFNCDIDYERDYQHWAKAATSKDAKKEINPSKLNRRIIAETCVSFAKNGVTLLDDDEEPVNFSNEQFVNTFAGPNGTSSDAVKGWLKIDGGINALASEIITRAGFGQAVVEGDAPKDR